jgi:putative phage-type endonuclease
MGVNPWKSLLQLFQDKIHNQHADLSNKEAVQWGIKLEPIVADEFERVTGKKVRIDNKIRVHPQYEYFCANLDRVVIGENAVLECKTTHALKAKEWENGNVPYMYYLQVQWQLFVSGFSKGYIACLIGGQHFVWQEIKKDNELISNMEEAANRFWNMHIIPQIPPKAKAKDNEFLQPSTGNGQLINLDDRIDKLIEELYTAKSAINCYEGTKKEIEAQIKQELGGCTLGETDNYFIQFGRAQKRFNQRLFKEENPDLFEQYQELTVFNQLIIRKKEGFHQKTNI